MNFERGAGILLHVTSLPSGDLGSAVDFVDRLANAGQKYWQVLPLGPTGWGDSPYACLSAFAGNVELVAADNGQRTMDNEEASSLSTIHYPLSTPFERFCSENWFWLDDYALFTALHEATGYKAWNTWEEPIRSRKPEAIAKAKSELAGPILNEKLRQFTFFSQWLSVKEYANEKGIKIIGDIPIYVAYDSCDVWCNQERFKLEADGSPTVVAGVPPDYFSKTGQLWGNPIYDWQLMRAEAFSWWVERVKMNLRMFDIVRLDHFIGFTRAWEVPAKDTTAENGKWVAVPGVDLFNTLRYVFGELPLIAEDLGEVTPEVEQLRDSFGLPGMRILQFAFGGGAYNEHMPHNHVPNSVVYTGTHDNETTVGWFKSGTRRAKHIKHCLKYLKSNGKEINWDMIAAAFGSVADIAIIPMQDVLGSTTLPE
jgi:4-alpha-glucanotransferase